MSKAQRLILVLAIVVVCVVSDQLTKAIARERLEPGTRISLVGAIIVLEYSENVGSFLSLGAQLPPTARFILMTVLAGAMVVGLLIVLFTSHTLPLVETIPLSLMAGGGIGNLIDRIGHQGAVADFLNVGIGSLRTGIFNVADVALTGGAIALAVLALLDYLRTRRLNSPGSP